MRVLSVFRCFSDIRIFRPPVGRPLGQFVGARPRGVRTAVRKCKGELGFRAFASFISHGNKVAIFWQQVAAFPIRPTRGSEPGSKADRHGREG